MAAEDGAGGPQSQTLDRGLRILEHLAAAGSPQPIADIGQALALHRSITYRLLRTLEDHQLVERDAVGHYRLGLGIPGLARAVRSDLQSAALPRLNALVADLGMTAFLVVRAGDEAVTVTSVEPQHSAAHVVYRPGTRHPVGRGAPGLALLMPEPPSPEDRDALRHARQTGWASSHGEVVPGLRSIAVPVLGPDGGTRAALAVVFVDDSEDAERVGRAVAAAAEKVSAALR
jgi:DNA-binding IclR family transcriptional regulator